MKRVSRRYSWIFVVISLLVASAAYSKENSMAAIVIFRLAGGELEYAPLVGEQGVVDKIVRNRMENLEYFKIIGADYIVVVQDAAGIEERFDGSIGVMVMESKESGADLNQYVSRRKRVAGREGVIDSSDILAKFGKKFKKALRVKDEATSPTSSSRPILDIATGHAHGTSRTASGKHQPTVSKPPLTPFREVLAIQHSG